MKRSFDKKKVEKAIKTIDDCCLHCPEEKHTDDCPIVVAEEAMKKCFNR